MNELMKLGKLAMHASCDDDPLVTDKDDKDSEDGDEVILKTDNLIAIGHMDGNAAILEVHGKNFLKFRSNYVTN